MMDTLVLNSAYMPVDRKSWADAISDLLTGRAEVVAVYEDRIVRSSETSRFDLPRSLDVLRTEKTGEWKVPSIIRFLGKAVFHRRGVRFNRHNVWLRDSSKCQYCAVKLSKADFTLDHVMPQSRGGQTKWDNVVVACLECNHKKANRTPTEARMALIREPSQPVQLPGQISPILSWSAGMPETWRDFLESVRYWHGKLQ